MKETETADTKPGRTQEAYTNREGESERHTHGTETYKKERDGAERTDE